MSAIKRFEDLIAWQKAQDLAVLIYQNFSKSSDYGFKDQICRASVSISNNIAEGFERNSDADFKRFLRIAKGSSNEVKSMIYLANRLNLIEEKEVNSFLEKTNEINRIISGLISSLDRKHTSNGKGQKNTLTIQ